MKIHHLVAASPLGPLLLLASDAALVGLHVVGGKYVPAPQAGWVPGARHPILRQAQDELRAYFDGRLREFTLPLAPQGTPFQQRAWAALLAIAYGQTQSYGQQARAMGQPAATRAVGAANGRNPICIVIPCHRVIGADGALTGYAGGLAVKRFLLRLEGQADRSAPGLPSAPALAPPPGRAAR